LEQQLAKKEERITFLQGQLSMFDKEPNGDVMEILAVSEDPPLSKADQIMAQVNLDVIESRGSQEQSTIKKIPVKLEDSVEASIHSQKSEASKTSSFPKFSGKPPRPPDSQASFESGVMAMTKEQARQFLKEKLKCLSEKYDFETEVYDEDYGVRMPREEDVYRYCKYVTCNAKMENEIPVVSLVYLERLLAKAGVLVNSENWRRLLLTSLCLASKVWDDDSLENCHFPKVLPDVTLKMIN